MADKLSPTNDEDFDPELGGLDEEIKHHRIRAADLTRSQKERDRDEVAARAIAHAIYVLRGKRLAIVAALFVAWRQFRRAGAVATAGVAATALTAVTTATVVTHVKLHHRPAGQPGPAATQPAADIGPALVQPSLGVSAVRTASHRKPGMSVRPVGTPALSATSALIAEPTVQSAPVVAPPPTLQSTASPADIPTGVPTAQPTTPKSSPTGRKRLLPTLPPVLPTGPKSSTVPPILNLPSLLPTALPTINIGPVHINGRAHKQKNHSSGR